MITIYLAWGLQSHGQSLVNQALLASGIEPHIDVRILDPSLLEYREPDFLTRWCFQAILQADIVFAFIDDRVDAQMIATEIGFARAAGKQVILAVSSKNTRGFTTAEFFVHQCADVLTTSYDDAQSALLDLVHLMRAQEG